MKIKKIQEGTLEENGYIIYSKTVGKCWIIDPGYKSKTYLNYVRENKLTIKGILLTHNHYDHIGAVKKIVGETDCPVYIHVNDMDMYKSEAIAIYDKDTFDLEGDIIEVIHTPGHTKGSVCFNVKNKKVVFTGDTVFNVDLGRTDLTGGNPKEMESTIKNIVNTWTNDVEIYPGHGNSCNMKFVKNNNQEFIDIMEK